MLSVCLKPQTSKRCVLLLLSLHAALLWVLATQMQTLWWAWLLGLLSAVLSLRQWRSSAAYQLQLFSDGSACLQWREQAPIMVTRCAGGMVSQGLLVAVWQDAQQRRYQTVLWPDSVTKTEFKMAYVWLRWQSVPHQESKQ